MTKTVSITDGVKSFPVGKLGHGLMHLTWVVPTITPDERAFEAIKLALDNGINYLDSGEFYGNGPPTLNLELVSRFFTKYPEYASKAFLSVKGGASLTTFLPDGSEEGIRRSVDNILKHLGGAKKMDLFQCARVDPNVPIEQSMATLKKLIQEGKFDYIGLSEVKAETIRRAHKVHPVAAVEVEYSPWSMDIEHNKVLETCKELDIPIIAYSPLGRGMLSGKIRSLDDLEPNDYRRHMDRFNPENFHHNVKLADKLSEIASKKGCTPVQLCLAWEMKQWEKIIPIPGSTRPDGVRECIGSFEVDLTDEEDHEIRKAVKEADIKGGRYFSGHEAFLEG